LVDNEKGILKIADLGLSRAFTVPMKSYTHEVLLLIWQQDIVTHFLISLVSEHDVSSSLMFSTFVDCDTLV
jgi:hypothetical protein